MFKNIDWELVLESVIFAVRAVALLIVVAAIGFIIYVGASIVIRAANDPNNGCNSRNIVSQHCRDYRFEQCMASPLEFNRDDCIAQEGG